MIALFGIAWAQVAAPAASDRPQPPVGLWKVTFEEQATFIGFRHECREHHKKTGRWTDGVCMVEGAIALRMGPAHDDGSVDVAIVRMSESDECDFRGVARPESDFWLVQGPSKYAGPDTPPCEVELRFVGELASIRVRRSNACMGWCRVAADSGSGMDAARLVRGTETP